MRDTVFVVHCERIKRKQAYKVWFPYNEQLVERIRNLPKDSRKWHGIEKYWELKTSALYQLIKSYKGSNKIHFDFGNQDSRRIFVEQIKKIEKKEEERKKLIADLEQKKEYWVKWKQELEENYLKYWDQLHKHLKEGVQLYPHQVVAAMFLNETNSALISHEMGLGKTASSIAYVEMNDFEKVLVITPNSLKFNYYNEVEKFTDSKAYVVNWKKNLYSVEEAKYVIVNYEYFNLSSKKKVDAKWKKLKIEKGELDCVICDESHRLKNTKSNTYKNFKRIFGKANLFRNKRVSKIFMTGTPAPNRAYELYTVLNQISPLDFPTKQYFYEYYCGMTYDFDGFGWVSDSSQAKLEELYHKIAPYTHRKRKKDVSSQLPDKIYQRIVLEMSDKNYKIYEDIENGIANDFIQRPTANPLAIMIRLRQYTSHLKVREISEIIDGILDTGEKIVIVDVFKDTLYEIYEKYKDIAGLHTGDQTVEERSEVVKRFQDMNDPMNIFIGSIQTINYGLTLTAANKMFIMSVPYSVGEYDQVSDRCHRIGQENIVNIYALVFPDTIDDYVYSSIEDKRAEIMKVIDNEEYKSNINDSVINDVINKIKEKHVKSR
jgi:SNF2 family DNA or RNA helicase